MFRPITLLASLLLSFLLTSPVAIGGNCPEKQQHNKQWDIDCEALYLFSSKVVEAVRSKNMNYFVELIDGELDYGPSKSYLNSRKFDDVFPDAFVDTIVKSGPTCSWLNYKGTFLGNGEIWIGSTSPTHFSIIAVNGYIPESKPENLPIGWPIDGKQLSPDCFVKEWISRDNFEAFAQQLGISVDDFRGSIGKHQAKLPNSVKPSWCANEDECESIYPRIKLNEACFKSKPISSEDTLAQGADPKHELIFENSTPYRWCRFRILGRIPTTVAQTLAGSFEANCIQSYLISILENYGGSMSFETVGIYGIFINKEKDKYMVPLKYFDNESSGKNYLHSLDKLLRAPTSKKNEHFVLNNLIVYTNNGLKIRVGFFSKDLTDNVDGHMFAYITNTYQPKYTLFDGVPITKQNLEKIGADTIEGQKVTTNNLFDLTAESIKSNNLFSFFSEEKTTLGVLYGNAGTREGYAKLLLVDTVTGYHTTIDFPDHIQPFWVKSSHHPPLMVGEKKDLIVRLINDETIRVPVVYSVRKFNDNTLSYKNDKDETRKFWKSRVFLKNRIEQSEAISLGFYGKDPLTDESKEAIRKVVLNLFYTKKINRFDMNSLFLKLCSKPLLEVLDEHGEELFLYED